jgi:hypothetical protein
VGDVSEVATGSVSDVMSKTVVGGVSEVMNHRVSELAE